VGASENCVAVKAKAKLSATAAMKILMDSPSSSGLGAGLPYGYHLPRWR
jgi:hypothetical protein